MAHLLKHVHSRQEKQNCEGGMRIKFCEREACQFRSSRNEPDNVFSLRDGYDKRRKQFLLQLIKLKSGVTYFSHATRIE